MTSVQGANDLNRVCLLLARYEVAHEQARSRNEVVARVGRRVITEILSAALALFDEIVADPARWQEGLRSGALGGLEPLRMYALDPDPGETFGVTFPDKELLMQRAIEARRCEP